MISVPRHEFAKCHVHDGATYILVSASFDSIVSTLEEAAAESTPQMVAVPITDKVHGQTHDYHLALWGGLIRSVRPAR